MPVQGNMLIGQSALHGAAPLAQRVRSRARHVYRAFLWRCDGRRRRSRLLPGRHRIRLLQPNRSGTQGNVSQGDCHQSPGAQRRIGRQDHVGDRASQGTDSGRTGTNRRAGSPFRLGRALGPLAPRDHRLRRRKESRAKPGHAAAQGCAGTGRGIRREQFSPALLGGRRRYRIGPRGRLSGDREGAFLASRDVRTGGARPPESRRRLRPARRRFPPSSSVPATRRPKRSSTIPPSRRWPSPARRPAVWRWSAGDSSAANRSPSSPR